MAQLLLSAAQAARPQAFEHAVAAMALAGALMIGHGGQTPEIRLAMLAGLLHDLGEMYIDPLHGEAETDRELDTLSYRQLVVHPHVGLLLIAQLTNYPGSVARAVAEHHERLDGSGYPHAKRGDGLSPLGRLMAVTDAALAALRGPHEQLLHASIALRAVPGEFDLAWVGQLSRAASEQPPLQPAMQPAEIRARRAALEEVLQAAEDNAGLLAVGERSVNMQSRARARAVPGRPAARRLERERPVEPAGRHRHRRRRGRGRRGRALLPPARRAARRDAARRRTAGRRGRDAGGAVRIAADGPRGLSDGHEKAPAARAGGGCKFSRRSGQRTLPAFQALSSVS